MNDPIDNFISQGLKNWAAHQQPPGNIKSRLLFKAASTSSLDQRLVYPDQPRHRQNMNGVTSQTLFPTPNSVTHYQPLLLILHLSLAPFKNIA